MSSLGNTYYDDFLKKKKSALSSSSDGRGLMTDRNSYIAFLEVQLERVTASTMTVQGFSERIEQLQSHIITSDEKIQNLTRLLKLQQQLWEERDEEQKKKESSQSNTITKLTKTVDRCMKEVAALAEQGEKATLRLPSGSSLPDFLAPLYSRLEQVEAAVETDMAVRFQRRDEDVKRLRTEFEAQREMVAQHEAEMAAHRHRLEGRLATLQEKVSTELTKSDLVVQENARLCDSLREASDRMRSDWQNQEQETRQRLRSMEASLQGLEESVEARLEAAGSKHAAALGGVEERCRIQFEGSIKRVEKLLDDRWRAMDDRNQVAQREMASALELAQRVQAESSSALARQAEEHTETVAQRLQASIESELNRRLQALRSELMDAAESGRDADRQLIKTAEKRMHIRIDECLAHVDEIIRLHSQSSVALQDTKLQRDRIERVLSGRVEEATRIREQFSRDHASSRTPVSASSASAIPSREDGYHSPFAPLISPPRFRPAASSSNSPPPSRRLSADPDFNRMGIPSSSSSARPLSPSATTAAAAAAVKASRRRSVAESLEATAGITRPSSKKLVSASIPISSSSSISSSSRPVSASHSRPMASSASANVSSASSAADAAARKLRKKRLKDLYKELSSLQAEESKFP